MIKHAMNNGLIMGGFFIGLYLSLILSLNFPTLSLIYLLLLVAVPILQIYLTKKVNNRYYQGNLRFSQRVLFGMLLYLFGSMIVAIPQYIHLQLIDPLFLTHQIEQAKELLQNGQHLFPAESRDSMMQILKEMRIPKASAFIFQQMSTTFYIGMLLSLLITPFTKGTPHTNNEPSSPDQ